MSMWLCRAGRYGESENKFLEDGKIYCTWDSLSESILKFHNKQDLQQYFVDNNSDIKTRTAINWAGQVWPFGHEMKKGEIVVLPSKINSVIHFGKITGDYEFLPNNDKPYWHAHQVDWFARNIPRTAFDQDILYSLGALMTICRIKQEARIKSIINKQLKLTDFQDPPQDPADGPAPSAASSADEYAFGPHPAIAQIAVRSGLDTPSSSFSHPFIFIGIPQTSRYTSSANPATICPHRPEQSRKRRASAFSGTTPIPTSFCTKITVACIVLSVC